MREAHDGVRGGEGEEHGEEVEVDEAEPVEEALLGGAAAGEGARVCLGREAVGWG